MFVCIIYVYFVYIYYVYINPHTYSIYLENIYMYLHVYIYMNIIYIINKHIQYISITSFSWIYIHACVYLYIHTNTLHIHNVNKNFFWMRLIIWHNLIYTVYMCVRVANLQVNCYIQYLTEVSTYVLKYFIKSFHVTTMKKWDFATM